jgi:hypothetical protein
MKRNKNIHSFASAMADINKPRSMFTGLSHRNKTSCNVGQLIPLTEAIQVIPGDTMKITSSSVIRLSAMLRPVMDDAFLDVYAFYVPHFLVWNNFKAFMGENINTS